MTHPIRSLARYAVLLLQVAASSGLEAESAWIESFEGAADRLTVVRSFGDVETVRVFLPLYEDDTVVVERPGDSVAIRLSDDSVRHVTVETSPFRVPPRTAAPGIVSNLMAWLSTRASDLVLEQETTVSMVTRTFDEPVAEEERLSAPLLTATLASIGPRQIVALGWTGGSPPFVAELKAPESGRILCRAKASELRRVWLCGASRPGRYRIELRDAEGARQSGEIAVLATHQLPALPPTLADSTRSDGFHAVLAAAWLAGQGEGEWSLEAYQRLSRIPVRSAEVRALEAALEAGERPTIGDL